MKRIPVLILFLAATRFCFAQLVASHDTTICAGQHVQLNATGGSTYTWAPSNTLSSSSIANPVAAPAVGTTTYVVSSPIPSGNLVVNGDFSQGNTGFTSNYLYEVPTNIAGSGSYFIGGNATHWNQGMSVACGDHTSGVDTNMLVANGALTANTAVWCQTLQVYPNSTYNLSAYIQELNQQNYPYLQWRVNGTNVGSATQAIFIQCIWTQATATWSSGVNTSATFCIVDPTTQGNGNDFAIDDISITATGTMRDTVVVTVINGPVVNLGNDTSLCTGQTLTFNAANNGATYLWSDNTTAQTLAVNAAGMYTVTVTNGSCSASDAVNVYTLDLTVTTAVVNTTCGLSNGQASVKPDNGTSPFTYVWSNTATNDTIYNISGGTYTVTVNDAAGCSAIGSAVVNTSGSGTLINITATQTQICATDSANICAPANYSSYLWNNGATSVCIHPSQAGNYYVTVTDNANCTSTSNHVAVSVFPAPSVSVSVNGDTLSAFNATAYQWYLNGNEITGATDSTYIATQSGSYTVQVADANGCTALSNQLQVVTGITDLLNDVAIDVYPNPNAAGSWQLSVSNSLVGKEMEVTDVTGKTVWKSEIRNQKSEIQVSIASGVYLLKINSGKNTYLKKLIKM